MDDPQPPQGSAGGVSIERVIDSRRNRLAAAHLQLRAEDIREVRDLHGLTAEHAIALSIKNSLDHCYIGRYNGAPGAVFGCATTSPGVGHPWLLGTTLIEKVPVAFVRASRKYVEEFNDAYPILTNTVDERNEAHLRWLRALGFTFIRRSLNRRGIPYLQFVRIKPCASLSQSSAPL